MTPEFQPVVRTIPPEIWREAQARANHEQAVVYVYDIGIGWAIESTRNPDHMADGAIAPRFSRRLES